MKKYHLADVLSLIEVVCAIVIVAATFLGLKPDIVIWIFALGELCDAFDGICARKWHYPNDGKKRWWREHASELDILSDLFIGLAILLYLTVHVNLALGLVILIVALLVGFAVQILVKWKSTEKLLDRYWPGAANFLCKSAWFCWLTTWFDFHRKTSLVLILIRRYLYVAAIGVIVVSMIFATSWPTLFQCIAFYGLVVIACALAAIKLDRLSQDKTPL